MAGTRCPTEADGAVSVLVPSGVNASIYTDITKDTSLSGCEPFMLLDYRRVDASWRSHITVSILWRRLGAS